MTNKEFIHWLDEKFLEWRNYQDDRKANLTRFAQWLGIKQSSLSHYLNGAAEPEGNNLYRIGLKLGFEVYGLLGYTDPDRAVKEWQMLYEITPDEWKEQLIQMNKDWLKKKGLK